MEGRQPAGGKAGSRTSGSAKASARGGMDFARLDSFFNPSSLALVGATDRSRWSWSAFHNWRTYSEGPCYLVHPRHQKVHGEPAFPSLSAIGESVDIAYVMVPTDQVLPVMEEAASIGIRNAVILTAGFGETGPEGAALEAKLVELAEAEGMLFLGPNGNGFVNAARGRTPYGLPIAPPLRRGPVGIVLQSGGLASVVLGMAQARGVGTTMVVSTGNEAMVGATDVIDYLAAQEETRAIAVFLESIRQPEHFKEVATAALEAGKAIVALKAGRSAAGSRAALAHTGAVAGDAAVVQAVLDSLDVVRVTSLEDLLTTAGLLGYQPRRLGRRLAVVAVSGGACDILADRASDEGLELPEYPPATLAALEELLPPYSNPHNPLDVTGYVVVDANISARSLEAVVASPAGHFDEVLYQTTIPQAAPPDPAPLMARYAALAELVARSPLPVLLQSSGPAGGGFADEVLDRFGFFVLDGIEHGMSALGSAVRWQERREALLSRPRPAPAPRLEPPPGATGTFGEARARALLAAHGVPVVPTVIVHNVGEALSAARTFGGPVALKVAADTLLHKSDLGGVELDLRTEEEIEEAAERLLAIAETHHVGDEGLQVAPMRRGGVELLASVRCDPAWGPILVVGLGGVWVEVLGETSLLPLPSGRVEIEDALRSLRGYQLLEGGRGRPGVDMEALIDSLTGIARLGEGLGDALDTLEVNPLWAGPSSCEALDALVVWAR